MAKGTEQAEAQRRRRRVQSELHEARGTGLDDWGPSHLSQGKVRKGRQRKSSQREGSPESTARGKAAMRISGTPRSDAVERSERAVDIRCSRTYSHPSAKSPGGSSAGNPPPAFSEHLPWWN